MSDLSASFLWVIAVSAPWVVQRSFPRAKRYKIYLIAVGIAQLVCLAHISVKVLHHPATWIGGAILALLGLHHLQHGLKRIPIFVRLQ